ncbi:MAG TPA: hypothetical protein DEO65_08740 [Bacillus bacterium]|uniref:competence protein ComK n=1 Tax=Siminovitchia fordii TaxID=254759 RepID=UPI00036B7534|nr:competence protein ComK [Siminovitchia fordii]HBZ09947.1 hypothetical protein [Bacillus sp. (in: firmicutes)]
MQEMYDYVIHKETMGILNRYDEYGNLCSLVVEEKDIYEVNESPLVIVKNSALFYGSSLEGAITGARAALGKISMSPVMIGGIERMYWFPSKSTEHEDCIWFSAEHIKDYRTLDDGTLEVRFHNDYSINIASTYYRFDQKVGRANKLKNIMERRTGSKRMFLYIPEKQFIIIKDGGRNHYKIQKRRK